MGRPSYVLSWSFRKINLTFLNCVINTINIINIQWWEMNALLVQVMRSFGHNLYIWNYFVLFIYCIYCINVSSQNQNYSIFVQFNHLRSYFLLQSNHCSVITHGNVTHTCPVANNWLFDWTLLLRFLLRQAGPGWFPIIAVCKTGSSRKNHRHRDVFSVTTHDCISWFGASQWRAGSLTDAELAG